MLPGLRVPSAVAAVVEYIAIDQLLFAESPSNSDRYNNQI
jgi:hypothetical protein